MSRLSSPAPRLAALSPRLQIEKPQRDERARDASAPWRRWYKLERWRKLRWKILTRDLFKCQMPGCGRVVADTSKLVCDHVDPHRGDERKFWDERNLRCICKSCHDSVKQKEEQASLHQRGVWY